VSIPHIKTSKSHVFVGRAKLNRQLISGHQLVLPHISSEPRLTGCSWISNNTGLVSNWLRPEELFSELITHRYPTPYKTTHQLTYSPYSHKKCSIPKTGSQTAKTERSIYKRVKSIFYVSCYYIWKLRFLFTILEIRPCGLIRALATKILLGKQEFLANRIVVEISKSARRTLVFVWNPISVLCYYAPPLLSPRDQPWSLFQNPSQRPPGPG